MMLRRVSVNLAPMTLATALSLLLLMPTTSRALAQRAEAGQGTIAPSGRVPFALEAVPPTLTPDQKKMREDGLKRTHRPGPPLPVEPNAVPTPSVPPTAVRPGPTALGSNTTPTDANAPPPSPGTFTVFRATSQTSSGNIATVSEPSAGTSGSVVFMSGNWFASYSTNGGASFTFVNPYTQFPNLDGGFCCDQTVIYDRSRDLMIWQLLYLYSSSTMKGSYRTAFAHSASVSSGGWCYYDWNPGSFGLGAGLWLDYPEVSLSNNFVWYTANIFNSNDQWQRTLIWRIPLDSASSCSTVSYSYFVVSDRFGFTLAQGALATMYWASNNSTSSIRIYNWPESSGTISWNDVVVSSWPNASRVCPGPDGLNWCARGDGDHGRTGWVAGGVIGFMWNASQGGSFPYPYVHVARFNESTRALIDQPIIWNSTFAFQYPGIAVDDRGHIAGTLYLGGGSFYPTMLASIWDDFSSTPPPWELYSLVASAKGASDWGDYYHSRRHGSNGNTWIVTGQAVLANNDVQAWYVWFGRERDGSTTPSLAVSPSSDIASSGNQGGPFSPSSFQYQLSATSGSVNYSITGTPNWLTPSAASGTVTTSPTTITFSVNSNANGFAPGTYGPTTITFTNTTNGQGNTTRSATLTVNSGGGAPANDNFANATTISGQSGSTTGTNVNATLQSGEPAPFAGTGTHTVWWKWTAPVSGEVTFNTAGSNFDTVLTAYTGSAVNALTLAAGNDDFNSTVQSSITFEVQAGFTYYIRVDGFSPSDTGSITLGWSEPLNASPLVAAVLPYARSVQFGQAATAFGVMINSGGTTATSCRPNVPAGFTDPFVYQTTNTSNQLTGSPNTPVNIGPGATQNFVFGYTPGSVLNAVEIGMVFDCSNTVPVVSVPGVNTFILSAASTPTPDIIAIGVTSSGDGIVNVPGTTGTGFFAAAGINIGSTATITASADDGGRGLPLTLTICQTDSGGNCMAPPAPSVTVSFANNASLTFTVFAQGSGNVPFDPAHNRLFLRFKDGGSVTRGATNVAVRTN